jgi:hypothetical protein
MDKNISIRSAEEFTIIWLDNTIECIDMAHRQEDTTVERIYVAQKGVDKEKCAHIIITSQCN